jgi:GNAT superfamily N-acetyltransferase
MAFNEEFILIIPYAFHHNWIGMFERIPHYHSPARCWHEDGLTMGLTGWSSATFNAAIIHDNDLLTVERIAHITDTFTRAGVSFTIQMATPTPAPISAELLWQADFSEILCDPMMTYEGPYAALSLNPGVLLQRVRTQHDIDLYYQIVAEGFDLPPVIEDFVGVMLRMSECQHVIAWLKGEPVGAGTLVETAGVAGIYNVATIPAARGHGVATAIMAALHRAALDDGYWGTALASSVMGLPLYRKLGYASDGYQVVFAHNE